MKTLHLFLWAMLIGMGVAVLPIQLPLAIAVIGLSTFAFFFVLYNK